MTTPEVAPIAARAAAVRSALIDKGLLAADTIDHIVHLGAEVWRPENGARVVAFLSGILTVGWETVLTVSAVFAVDATVAALGGPADSPVT